MKNNFLENDINSAILEKNNNKLIYIGINYGFSNENYRFECYLLLLNINIELLQENSYEKLTIIENKIDQINVIKKDIKRTFHNRKEMILNEKDKENLMQSLYWIISKYFYKNSKYRYYQGFNSLVEVLYLKYGKSFTFILLDKLCLFYFDAFLISSHVEVMQIKINQIKIILKQFYPIIFEYLKDEYYN